MIASALDHLEIFVRHYMPSGKAWDLKNTMGSSIRNLANGFTEEFARGDLALNDFIQEMMPDTTDEYVSRWEKAVGIPDDCFEVAADLDTRRLNVQRKLSLLGLQTKADFEGFAASLGVFITARSGADHVSVINGGYGNDLPVMRIVGGISLSGNASISTTGLSGADYKIDTFTVTPNLSSLFVGEAVTVENTTTSELGEFNIHSIINTPGSEIIYLTETGTPVSQAPFTGAGEGYEIINVAGDFTNIKDARFTLVITSIESSSGFDYSFDFPFESPKQTMMVCVFRAAKPANCNILFNNL
jgi:hypothetical protein